MFNNRVVQVRWSNLHHCYRVLIKYYETDKGFHILRSDFEKAEHGEMWAYANGYEVE